MSNRRNKSPDKKTAQANIAPSNFLKIWTKVDTDAGVHDALTCFCIETGQHACGQWLVFDEDRHHSTINEDWTGFRRIYRNKFKPLAYSYESVIDVREMVKKKIWVNAVNWLNEFGGYSIKKAE